MRPAPAAPPALDGVAAPARRAWLAAIVAAGGALRFYRLSWGLPDYVFPDGFLHFVRPAARLAATGELVQGLHPPLLTYTLALVYLGRALVTGTPVPGAGPALHADLPALALVGRGVCAGLATASIAALYLVARRLAGTRAALLAAAAFALTPLHVLESHRINPDGPMLLLALLAAATALAAAAREHRGLLVAAFVVAGLATTAKYTGLAGVAVPAWIALRWPGMRGPARVRLLAAGGVATMVAAALVLGPALLDWARFEAAFRTVADSEFGVTQPGVDLSGGGWVYVRYVYALAVALPYAVGWPVYLAGLAGIVVLARHDRRAAAVVLVATVPFFAVQGWSRVIVARYYLPLVPWLALGAGVTLDRLWNARSRAGCAAATLLLGYTAALAASQCLRLGLGPQNAVAAFVAARARPAAGRPLVVGYPDANAYLYDALRPRLRRLPVRVVNVPVPYQNVRTEGGLALADEELLAGDRRWAAESGVDVVVLPSWVENAIVRERPEGYAARFYRRLGAGWLGFHLAAEFRTRFLTESLYVWGDPMLDTHWETGIAGYKVFARDQPPAP
jgi:4-amino-4-deoxy-L-arabinose transferase-like glycosyltransferase